MRAIRVLAFMVRTGALLLFIAGCAGDGGSTVRYEPDETDVRTLWIDGYYRHFAVSNPWMPVSGAIVFVREENHAGNPVADVTVRLGGAALSYDESAGAYRGAGAEVESGGELALVVSSEVDSVSATVTVPFPPKNLYLRSDTWDISGPEIGNTLRWTPPDTLGERLVVYLYTSTRGEDHLIWYGGTDHPESDYLTVYNHELPYYSTLRSVTAIVCQADYALFEENPNSSAFTVLACAWGSWATTLSKAVLP